MAIKILLDTDIGSDIDDAVCLAYLLSQPDCELMGITTVTGEPVERAKLASVLCKVAGKDIPIFPGAEKPFLVNQQQPFAPQRSALSKWPHAESFPQGQAVEFLRQTILAHPGEITLLTIGPLTNIGLLFALDPEIPSLLKSLVLMCGVFTNRIAGVGPLEWNAIGDPHATAIVYRAAVAQHLSIGLDVTMQVRMNAALVKQKFQAPLLRPVLDFAEVWFLHTDTVVFHDPLAATTIFDHQICTFTPGQVDIELTSPRLYGLTYFDQHPQSPKHQVALEVNPQRFFDHYFSVVH
jgi:purine nucleosidase